MKVFYPNRYFDKKEDIPFEHYFSQGYKAVIFDIDNTLVPHDAPANDNTIAFINRLKEIGYSICLLSNNDKERVSSFNEPLQVHYIYKGAKPLKKGYLKAMEIMGSSADNTIFVGDQIYTDILGARMAGLHSILLDPINPKEEIQIVLKRIPEKYIKWNYRRKNHLDKNEYDSI